MIIELSSNPIYTNHKEEKTDALVKSETEITITEIMTTQEAKTWELSIEQSVGSLRSLLAYGYEHQVWVVLGYKNWTECLQALADKYGFKERHAWELHSANETQKLLRNCAVGEIPEYQLRPLSALPDEQKADAWGKVIETAPNGVITGKHVQQVVDEIRRPVSYHVSDDSYDWYTPSKYIEAARLLMGNIDLDPASTIEAQSVIKAKEFYTKEIDGLTQKWSGNVWLNPPYNMPLVEYFVNKIVEEYKSGAIISAVVLTNNSTDTGWFHSLLNYPVCFTKGRIKFWNGNDILATRQGQALFYLGKETQKFTDLFGKFGTVLVKL